MQRFHPRLAIVLILVGSVGCGPDKGDKALADDFVQRLSRRDSTAMTLVVPNGDIAKVGWAGIAPILQYTTAGEPRFERWETVSSTRGTDRKFTYGIAGNPSVFVDVYVEHQGDHRYVNTVRGARR